MSKKDFSRKHFNFAVPIESLATDGDSTNDQRTFDGLAYSGEVIPRHFVFQNLYIDLDSIQAKSQIPIFRDHDASLVAGHGSLYKDSQNKLRVSGKLSKNSIGSEITQLADEGFAWEMSIGAVPEYIEDVPEGKSFSVNGVQEVGPASIFRNTRIIETSFVPIGADSNTEVSVFSKDGHDTEIETITVEVREMENEIKPVEVTEVETPEIEIKEVAAMETSEEIIEEMEVDVSVNEDGEVKLSYDQSSMKSANEVIVMLGAELACSCTEKKAAKSDLEKAQDTIKELQKEISELRNAKKKENFSAKAAQLGMELSEDQVDFLFVELSDEDKFEKVLAIMSEQAKNIKPFMPKALLSKDQVEVDFGNVKAKGDSSDITAKAKKMVAKLAEEGKTISFTEAVAKVSNWSM